MRLALGLGLYALVEEARTFRASQRLLGDQSMGAALSHEGCASAPLQRCPLAQSDL